MGIITVLWEKWVEFRRDFYKITMAAMISPLMYLLIFGFGIQTTSHGEPYLMFLIPGIVAMSTMTGSFGAVAQNMSVQRLYEKALDQVNNDVLVHLYLGQHPEMAAKLKGAEAIEDNLDKLSIAFAIDLDRILNDDHYLPLSR